MMSCCCDQQPLLGTLMGAMLAKGSRVRLGFAYDIYNPGGVTDPSADDNPSYISEVIYSALMTSGDFEVGTLDVRVTPSAYLGLQDGYILIQGVIGRDKGDPRDIENAVLWAIRNNLPVIDITRRDPIIIDYVPPTQAGNPNVAQVNTPREQTPRGTLPGDEPPSKSFWQEIADELDMQKTEAQLLILGGGALLLVLMLKR